MFYFIQRLFINRTFTVEPPADDTYTQGNRVAFVITRFARFVIFNIIAAILFFICEFFVGTRHIAVDAIYIEQEVFIAAINLTVVLLDVVPYLGNIIADIANDFSKSDDEGMQNV